MFAFVVPQLDELGAKQYVSSGKKCWSRFRPATRRIQLDFTAQADHVQPDVGGTLVNGELPIDFSTDPGVNIDIDAKLQAQIDYLMGIGLGIGNVSRTRFRKFGFFIDTTGVKSIGEELSLDVSATLGNGSTATGTLGFLKMQFTESQVDGEETGLWGHFGLDLRDADGGWKVEDRRRCVAGHECIRVCSGALRRCGLKPLPVTFCLR